MSSRPSAGTRGRVLLDLGAFDGWNAPKLLSGSRLDKPLDHMADCGSPDPIDRGQTPYQSRVFSDPSESSGIPKGVKV